MSVLAQDAPLFDKFLHGDWGYAHGAEESIIWLGILLFSLIILRNPIILILITLIIGMFANRYWYFREIQQFSNWHKFKVDNIIATLIQNFKYWSKDSRDDVLRPNEYRLFWYNASMAIMTFLLVSSVMQ